MVTTRSGPAFDQRTAHLLLRLGRLVDAGVTRAAAPLGGRARHLHVLALVDEQPMSQRELGERSGYDRTTMVAVIDELEAQDLVQRRRGERDRRRFFVVPTPQGKKVLAAALDDLAGDEETLLGTLSSTDRERLDTLLRRLLQVS